MKTFRVFAPDAPSFALRTGKAGMNSFTQMRATDLEHMLFAYPTSGSNMTPCLIETLSQWFQCWTPSGGYLLQKGLRLLPISGLFPSLCNFASAHETSP
jgi:hypothetical protein